MHSFTVVLLVGLSALATAMAVGQYYVPRAYYTIDHEGHVSAPVPLRRLRRSLHTAPLPHSYAGNGASATASASSSSDYRGNDASASAQAQSSSNGGGGNWYPGGGVYYPGGWAGGGGGHGHGYVHPVLGYH